MKHLADRLVKSPLAHDVEARRVAALIKRPAENHTDQLTPMVERFVFAESDLAELGRTAVKCDREALFSGLKAPMPLMWIEVADIGFLVRNGWVTLFNKNGKIVHSVCRLHIQGLTVSGAQLVHFESHCSNLSRDQAALTKVKASFTIFATMCALINSPRSATVERITRKEMRSHEQKVFAMRRAQRGAPVYSFNRITINRPETSLQRGEVVNCGPQTSKRGHYVIGHWRLLDGKAEPYWVWIESHPRGDETLGFVAHERHVKIEPGSFGSRRGFELPTFPGASGQRIKAQRAG